MANRIRSTNLLLLPGMMCDAGLWRAQADEFAGDYLVQCGDISQDDDIVGIAKRVLAAAPASFARG